MPPTLAQPRRPRWPPQSRYCVQCTVHSDLSTTRCDPKAQCRMLQKRSRFGGRAEIQRQDHSFACRTPKGRGPVSCSFLFRPPHCSFEDGRAAPVSVLTLWAWWVCAGERTRSVVTQWVPRGGGMDVACGLGPSHGLVHVCRAAAVPLSPPQPELVGFSR